MSKCFIPRCKSGYKSNPEKVSLFRLPGTGPPDLLSKWQEAIPRKDILFTGGKNQVICQKHFDPDDIITYTLINNVKYYNLTPRLRPTAVPRKFPSCEPDLITANPERRLLLSREQCLSNYPGDTSYLFKTLLKNSSAIKFPNRAWNVFQLTNSENEPTIVIGFVEFIKTKTVMQKQIRIKKNGIKFYIRDVEIEKAALFPTMGSICNVKNLNDALLMFEEHKLCAGWSGFTSPTRSVKFDSHYDTWRHKCCQLIVSHGITMCTFCKNISCSKKPSSKPTGSVTSVLKREQNKNNQLKRKCNALGMRLNDLKRKYESRSEETDNNHIIEPLEDTEPKIRAREAHGLFYWP